MADKKKQPDSQPQTRVSEKKQPSGSVVPSSMPVDIPGTMPVEKRMAKMVAQHASYEGPIPPPEIFRQYGEIIPNAPERILKVFEEDSKHVRDIEMGALNAQKADNKRIHWMAWSLVMTGFILSAVFAYMNKDLLAGAILTTTIGAIAYSFLNGEKDKTSEANKISEAN